MTHLFNGLALAALIALALPVSAEAHRGHDHGWYGYSWGPPRHAANDFVAGQLNRAVLAQIGLRGGLGLDQVALNPQPLPPREAWR